MTEVDGQQDGQEQPSDAAGQTGTALVPGNTFLAKALQYRVTDGLAMFEGDIVLGTVEEVEQQNEQLKEQLAGETASAVVLSGAQFRWPGGVIPHRVDSGLADQARASDAIAHWEANTNYRFPTRTTEPNFVTFRAGPGCSANIGRRGGEQFVNVGPACTAGNLIHEIGHTVGLWHEQSREDRDLFITVHFENIIPGFESEFSQHISDGDDVGPYDYGSIMHYPRNAFSIDRATKDTIVPTVGGAQIGQRSALSPNDIAAANSLITGTAPTPPGPTPPGPTPTPPVPVVPPPFSGRLIKFPPLTSGPDVATWQARMNERGFTLAVDGKYGQLSKTACIDLQNQKSLSPDGIVGPLTWAATFGP